jgi:C-terminal processing protease CtpA/Prc
VILKVGDRDVESTDEAVKLIRNNEPGDEVELTIKRKRRTRTVEVELGKTQDLTHSFMKGHGAPGKFHMDKIKLPDIENIRKRVKVYRDDDDGHIKVYKYDDDDMEDFEVFGFDSDDLEDDMEELEEDMEELRKELKELQKQLEELRER